MDLISEVDPGLYLSSPAVGAAASASEIRSCWIEVTTVKTLKSMTDSLGFLGGITIHTHTRAQ